MTRAYPQAIVVLAGRRDQYQLPLALNEANLLGKMVTDIYWPADRQWFAASLGKILPKAVVASRFTPQIPSDRTTIAWRACTAFALSRIAHLDLNRYSDRGLSQKARATARRHPDEAVFSYHSYAADAFRPGPDRPRYRFLHLFSAHPSSVRRILGEEAERTPLAKASITSFGPMRFAEDSAASQNLIDEVRWANGWVVPSSFVAQTLVENGIPADQLHIVPYGVDTSVFTPRKTGPDPASPFTVVFAGSVVQLKGITYLLEALRLLASRNVRLILYSRTTVHTELLEPYQDVNVEVRVGLSGKALASEIQKADVFVSASLIEGLSLSLIEAMGCGLPIIGTPHTSIHDLVEEGVQGFAVPIRCPEAIAEKLAWGVDHRAELAAMGQAAAQRARLFTWDRYRAGIRTAYQRMIEKVDQCV